MRLTKSGTPDKRFKDTEEGTLTKEDIQKAYLTEEGTLTKEDIQKAYLAAREEPLDVVTVTQMDGVVPTIKDPQELFNQLLKDNNLQIDFDVVEGTVETPYGIIKLDKPVLAVKASYVASK